MQSTSVYASPYEEPSKMSTFLPDMPLPPIPSEQEHGQSPLSTSSEEPPEPQEEPCTELYQDDKHIYTNIVEMEAANGRLEPPRPGEGAEPRRLLHSGWSEYATETGRTYFFHSSTGKSQWNPPRLMRSPAQVQAMLRSTADQLEKTAVISNQPAVHSQAGVRCASRSETIYQVACASSGDELDERPPDRHAPPPPPPPLHIPHATQASCQPSPPSSLEKASPPRMNYINRAASLKQVPLPMVLPSASGEFEQHRVDQPLPLSLREEDDVFPGMGAVGSSGESQRSCPVMDAPRTIRSGNMDKAMEGGKKREWTQHFMFLTSAHLILYKDEKSAEKHGKHYAAPLGVLDLRGAIVAWNLEKERKKKRVIQLELSNGQRFLLRTCNDAETMHWFEALADVIAGLPSCASVAATTAFPIQPALIDQSSLVMRHPSALSQRPLSAASVPINRGARHKKPDPMSQSAIESSSVVSEPAPNRATIIDRLKRFFRTRPTVETLKEKGIYKPEPVFGSTLAAICQLENSLVPKFLRVVTELIEGRGLEVDGLYRVSGNLSAVQRIRCHVDQDKYQSLVSEEDVHVLTGALKLFFRELSEPAIPPTAAKGFMTANKLPSSKARMKRFDELLKELPAENRETLKMLLRHLQLVASHSAANRMQAHNLAIMFGPTLFSSGDEGKGGGAGKKKDKDKKKTGRKDECVPVQSNSHMAFNMIMQGQIVEVLLTEQARFEALQGPVKTHRD